MVAHIPDTKQDILDPLLVVCIKAECSNVAHNGWGVEAEGWLNAFQSMIEEYQPY